MIGPGFRNRTVAFTGHRPARLPDHGEASSIWVKRLKYDLCCTIHQAIRDGYLWFLSGMALGFDLWAAQAVLSFREIYPQIALECVVPYQEHGQEACYQEILDRADAVTVLSTQYYDGCLLARNDYLVDHASLLISYCTQKKGSGTGYTVRRAQQQGLRIVELNDHFSDQKWCERE